jgi:hypothetical protein
MNTSECSISEARTLFQSTSSTSFADPCWILFTVVLVDLLPLCWSHVVDEDHTTAILLRLASRVESRVGPVL